MSLKGDKYETTEEVKFRLESSIVVYDGEPVYISQVMMPGAEDAKEIARVFFYSLPLVKAMDAGRKEATRKYLSSRKFDLSPFKMGYMNHLGEATFVSRAPLRQNKQGLTQATTVLTNCMGKKSDRITFGEMCRAQGFVDMFHGKYPSFKEAGEMLNEKNTTSVAVSRSFAFIIDDDLDALYLLHKGVKCGLAMKGDKAVKVPQKFHFLKEEMEDHRIPMM